MKQLLEKGPTCACSHPSTTASCESTCRMAKAEDVSGTVSHVTCGTTESKTKAIFRALTEQPILIQDTDLRKIHETFGP